MKSNLKDVTLYDLTNQPILSCADAGTLCLDRTRSSIISELILPRTPTDHLVAGQSYYAVGLSDQGHPVRSETLIFRSTSGEYHRFNGEFPLSLPAGQRKDSDVGSPAMLITYTNYSTTTFSLSTNWSNLQDGFGGRTVSPGPTLPANGGQQSLGADQLLSIVDAGPADIGLCWAEPTGLYNFGVWIHFNLQVLGIGPRPIWYVSTNGSDWTLAGSDPSDPYTWTASSVGGLNITGTPSSGHSSLNVSVVISNQQTLKR